MATYSTDSDHLFQTKEVSLEPKKSNENTWVVLDSDIQLLRCCRLAMMIAIIRALSKKKSFCYTRNSFFMEKLSISNKTVDKNLKKLEDLNLIHRNTWAIPNKGCTRHIVLKENASRYWREYLSKPGINRKAINKFTSQFGPHEKVEYTGPFLKNKSDTPKMVLPPKKAYNTVPKEGVICNPQKGGEVFLTNNRLIQDKQRIRKKSVVVDFPVKLREELKKSRIEPDMIQKAVKFAKEDPERFKKLRNPVGWFVAGIKQGWIHEEIERHELLMSQRSPYADATEISDNKMLFKRVIEQAKRCETESHTMTHNDLEVIFIQKPPADQPRALSRIEFRDLEFKSKMKLRLEEMKAQKELELAN